MTVIDTGLEGIKRQHPEWEPWLAVIQEVLRETADAKWDAFVPDCTSSQQTKVPLLAGATVALDMRSVLRLLDQLIQTAYRSGTPKMATLEPVLHAELDVVALLRASLCQDSERLKETATILGADPEAFEAVAALLAVPFLQACNRRWSSAKRIDWMEGYCPVCGAWPSFGEVRGIERSRYFRCGRCGGEWQAHCLFCPYCGMTDHNELASLVPEKAGANSVIESCKRCLGYVKTFTKLQGSPAAKVILDDLASVDLDVAALEQGYRRPQGAGYALNATVTDNGATRRSGV
jgi:FdhE protein